MELRLERSGARVVATPSRPDAARWVEDVLFPACCYDRRVFVAGQDRRRGSGRAVQFVPVALARRDGASVGFPIGLYARIRRLADRDGVRLSYIDRTPPPARPDALRFDADAVARAGFSYRGGPEGKQAAAVAAAAAPLAHRMPCIIDASYGFGKTALIVAVALGYPRAKIAVVNAVRAVVDRTYDDLRRHLPASEVGVVRSGRAKRFARVTVYSAGSLGYCPVERASGDYPDLLVGDEIHELATDERMPRIWRAGHYAALLGLTGTPSGRRDGSDLAIEALFGPTVFRATYAEAVADGLVTPIEVRMIRQSYPSPVPPGAAADATFRYGIWRNERRNGAFADAAARHVAEGDRVLLLVETTEHALYLRQQCRLRGLDPGLAVASIDPRARPAWERRGLLAPDELSPTQRDLDALAARFRSGEARAVVATKVWRTGVSFDDLAVVVWAAAGAAPIPASQGLGRVSRVAEGKPLGIVYDGDDAFDERAARWSRDRRAVYRGPRHNWRIVDVDP